MEQSTPVHEEKEKPKRGRRRSIQIEEFNKLKANQYEVDVVQREVSNIDDD